MIKRRKVIAQILFVTMMAAVMNFTCVKGIEEKKVGIENIASEQESLVKVNNVAEIKNVAEVKEEEIDKNEDSNSINEEADIDNDGLEDGLEEVFGADPNKKDTDEDGLEDLTEIKLSLSPAKADTNGDGKGDLQEDTDGDGLSNEEEIKIGSELGNKDSDNDGISDGDEVKIYGTSPLKSDTDGDSILDGDELKLGLNPNNQYSNGVDKDSDVKIQQVLSKDRISQVIFEENVEFIPSISGKISGLLDRKVFVNAYDVTPIKNIEGLVGQAVDIKSECDSKSSLDLRFDCRKYLENNKEADIENLAICRYKDNNCIKLDTKVNKEDSSISTDINEAGVYFIIYEEKKSENIYFYDFQEFSLEKNYSSISENIDSDYDGIDDDKDSMPDNNNFSGTLKTKQATSKVSYTMDYRNFFAKNKQYNSNIATVSSLFAATTAKGNTFDGVTLDNFMAKHGMSNVKIYDLSKLYNDSDLTEAYIGHRKVTYDGETKEIISIVVRGTNGTVKEWGSNFDVGSTVEKNKYPDWKITSNHKGFDVAATRILKCLDEYESGNYMDKSVQKTYWVMGHSRGGAIANILGARLINSSKDVYAYTMAAPSTTTASDAEDTNKYSGIYNVLNKEDFVTLLPTAQWGFKHYGKSYVSSIEYNYKDEWQALTGEEKYKSDASGINNTVSDISKIIHNRNEAYIYECKCHGNGKRDDITVTNYGMSKNSREKAIKKIPSNALPYCILSRRDGKFLSGWNFTLCEQPEYFMQLLAAFMGKEISAVRFAVELDCAERYIETKLSIIKSGIIGVAHPHYNESYYLLTKHI